MSSSDDGSSRYHQLVLEARWQMQQARNHYWEEQASRGTISSQTQQMIATRALQYYDVLWEFKDDNPDVRSLWNDSGVDRIKELGSEKRTIEQDAPGDTAATNTVTRTALMTVDPKTVIDLTKKLDDIAKNLGFSAAVDGKLPRDKLSESSEA